jgi:hypothetical protein|tara:strand:+ start:39649 stop:42096 length:2448 start_codon:yes stop_codon:yes gene_type:complete
LKTILKFSFFLYLISYHAYCQNITVEGFIKDTDGNPIENISVSFGSRGTNSKINGEYKLTIPSGKEIKLEFSHISYSTLTIKINTLNKNTIQYSPILQLKTESLDEINLKNKNKKIKIITIDITNKTPGANAGVENVLMTLPGVNNNNELSSQYNVRGGNFDENLVYINGIEVYRPFLIRSGQQEGLSFVNSNMTEKVNFSAGGFQSKYGDKLSSVLDITYRKPTKFAASAEASLLGGSATVESSAFHNKLSFIIGARYRDNSLLVNNKDIETDYSPKFIDIQTFVRYDFGKRFKLDFLGNYSKNNYNYTPITRRTKFGTLTEPLELIVFYNGQEKDQYTTIFGSFKGHYIVNNNFEMSLTASAYNTTEVENYDILASYNLEDVESNFSSEDFGEVQFSKGIGNQLNHARNNLDAFITNVQLKSSYKQHGHHFEFGVKYQKEAIKDRLIEWEVIDSAGFNIRPPNHSIKEEPYAVYEGEILPYQNVRAFNNITLDRISGFIQWTKLDLWGDHNVSYNLGVRAQTWKVSGENITTTNNQTIVSPRGQITISPNWERDMLFRLSTGFYHQPPFYREFRDSTGKVQPMVKAQKSYHIVLSNDYNFNLWERPFKLVSEIYYKHLTDVNPYTINNVRIRYSAKNNAVAYATGLEVRLNGEFVPGTESWISMGIMTTKENIENKGYIPRPTDQRFKMAILFQDYVPTIPAFRMYLNLVFNSGLPGGSPSYVDPYKYQNRLNSYKRADVGLIYAIIDQNKEINSKFLKSFKELNFGIEIYNLFDIQNSITNTWVRDVYSKRSYGIPNYMTGRVFNLKLTMTF